MRTKIILREQRFSKFEVFNVIENQTVRIMLSILGKSLIEDEGINTTVQSLDH